MATVCYRHNNQNAAEIASRWLYLFARPNPFNMGYHTKYYVPFKVHPTDPETYGSLLYFDDGMSLKPHKLTRLMFQIAGQEPNQSQRNQIIALWKPVFVNHRDQLTQEQQFSGGQQALINHVRDMWSVITTHYSEPATRQVLINDFQDDGLVQLVNLIPDSFTKLTQQQVDNQGWFPVEEL